MRVDRKMRSRIQRTRDSVPEGAESKGYRVVWSRVVVAGQ